jgi:uncharacterized protein (DUF1330 family)
MARQISTLVALALGAVMGAACTSLMGQAHKPAAQAPAPAPAYMLVIGKVHDRAAFGEGYAAKLPPLYERFGGGYLAIGSAKTMLEGEVGFESYVLARWPSEEAALAFWNSPEYDELRRARIDNGWGDFDVVLLPGLPDVSGVAPMVADPAGN